MKQIFILILCSLFISAPAQNIIVNKKNNDFIIDIDTLTGIKNKPVIFRYDTLYTINQFGLSEIIRYAGDITKIKKINLNASDLSDNLHLLKTIDDSLQLNFKSLSQYFHQYELKTNIVLDSLTNDNFRLKQNIESMSGELEVVNKNLKSERKKELRTNVFFGLGGFVAGTLVALIISL